MEPLTLNSTIKNGQAPPRKFLGGVLGDILTAKKPAINVPEVPADEKQDNTATYILLGVLLLAIAGAGFVFYANRKT